MLVLVIRNQESALIRHPDGTEIEVKVLSVENNSVRIGFTAPREVIIERPSFKRAKKRKAGEEHE